MYFYTYCTVVSSARLIAVNIASKTEKKYRRVVVLTGVQSYLVSSSSVYSAFPEGYALTKM